MKVFVSGSFDLLHSGHVAFLREASMYGDLYVGIGSDKSIKQLKGRETINPQEERLYMVKAIRYVRDAWVNSGMGVNDFFNDLPDEYIDILIVNDDQDTEEKRKFCLDNQIKYVILQRKPEKGLPVRSSTALRNDRRIFQ
jgi:cytidyltransferase-like protein